MQMLLHLDSIFISTRGGNSKQAGVRTSGDAHSGLPTELASRRAYIEVSHSREGRGREKEGNQTHRTVEVALLLQ